jgi:hypothetical protein
MASAEQMVAKFLQLLQNPGLLTGADTELASALDLGSALLNVQGDINATETLAGLNEGQAFESGSGGIRVRQITGVLNIGISIANSGDNVSESSVVGADPLATPLASQVLGEATILTGPVDVMGLRSTVCVTQIKGDAADFPEACPPAVTPVTPPVTPPVDVLAEDVTRPTAVLPAAQEASVAAGSTLPFTGSPIALEALFGLALTGGGVLLQRRSRRTQ